MRRDWYFECRKCGAKLGYDTANDDEKLRSSGWLLQEFRAPSALQLESESRKTPEGYSTIHFTCPICRKGEMDEKRQDLENR